MNDDGGAAIPLPIVFLGPSMDLPSAQAILSADYRAPIKRGDLVDIPSGSLVGIIDGVFQQVEAVSPREVHQAIERGVHIVGASSMGALRALEVTGMHGVGRVYEMYRSGLLVHDDEVALALDPDTGRALTVPLVNLRFAIERLVDSGSLDRALGERILTAAQGIHFSERHYPAIMEAAGLAQRPDIRDLIDMLRRYDLKRDDAHTLLEHLGQLIASGFPGADEAALSAADAGPAKPKPDYGVADNFDEVEAAAELAADAPVMIWETGDEVEFSQLVLFLQMTNRFERYAKNALARYAMDGNSFDLGDDDDDDGDDDNDDGDDDNDERSRRAQRIFRVACQRWGWKTSQETHVTIRDLGLGTDDLGERCGEEAAAELAMSEVAMGGSDEFLRALRAELFLNDFALKREAMRLASLLRLAAKGRLSGPVSESEFEAARGRVMALHRLDWYRLRARLARCQIDPDRADQFIETLALARRAVRAQSAAVGAVPGPGCGAGLGLASRRKAGGDPRYCMAMDEALAATERLREAIGITRVGMIGELGAHGVQISQAARPSGRWSSTYGSGKGETQAGAMVGGVMEEVEKWAQEQFRPEGSQLVVASYRALGDRAVDPARFDLPYDSCYRPDLEIEWYPCWDLIQEREVLAPLALLTVFRCRNDISFSRRGSRRVIGTNGLASGFALEEALNHAICEVVERHATRLDDVRTTNPGSDSLYGHGRFIAADSYSDSLRVLIASIEGDGVRKLLLKDITCELGIPVFVATLFIPNGEDWSDCLGWGSHPNPEVAAKMAVFEAAQTWIGAIAGGREDLTVKARSLGRHERPRPYRFPPYVLYTDPDRPSVDLGAVGGLVSDDVYEEVKWLVSRLRRGGIEHLLALDLSQPEIDPARVCRVVIPDLDTPNPFYISDRARAALLDDLLPAARR